MWSSGGDDNNRVSSASSSKSSSSSSSRSSILPNPRRKTMEEVWKDISLTSLHDNSSMIREEEELLGPLPKATTTTTNTTTFPGLNNLQEFLARPFNKDPQPPTTLVSNSTTRPTTTRAPLPPPTPPALATILSLNNPAGPPEFPYMENNDYPFRPHIDPRLNNHCNDFASSFVANFSSTFDVLGSSSSLSPFCKKRVSDTDDNTGDRRHKRMIKNRESAARSRARKQAYTNELELEVAHLMEENAKLRKQHQQLYLAAAAHQLPKKSTLQRTSTAPF